MTLNEIRLFGFMGCIAQILLMSDRAIDCMNMGNYVWQAFFDIGILSFACMAFQFATLKRYIYDRI